MLGRLACALLVLTVLAGPSLAQPLIIAPPAATAKSWPLAYDKQCAAAKRREAKERAALDRVLGSLAQEQRGRARCTSAARCKRFDTSIRALESRQARHEAKLVHLEREAARSCTAK